MRFCWVVLALCACSPSRPTIEAPAPDPRTRSRVRLSGDPTKVIERMRANATRLGCTIEERTNGTFIACGDVDVWIVPEPNAMEVTCTGLPVNCNRRGRELSREEDEDAGSE